jgi:hypothetical protein
MIGLIGFQPPATDIFRVDAHARSAHVVNENQISMGFQGKALTISPILAKIAGHPEAG